MRLAKKNARLKRKCADKVRHKSKGDAQIAVLKAFRKGDCQHPYKCPFCGTWHIGHNRAQRISTELRKINNEFK